MFEMPASVWLAILAYSQVPIKQVGPNKQVGWTKMFEMQASVWLAILAYSQVPIKQVGPNKQVGWIF